MMDGYFMGYASENMVFAMPHLKSAVDVEKFLWT